MIGTIVYIVFAVIIITLLFRIDRLAETLGKMNRENENLKTEVKSLKYNYTNLMKLYKSTLNKIKVLNSQLKKKGN